MTSEVCSGALEVTGREPLAVCSLVRRVELVETTVGAVRREMKSQGRRLTLVVGAMGAVSPHLVSLAEWLWAHSAGSLVPAVLALLG